MGQTSAILPFDAFLDVLRSKGYGVSLHEYAAMASLLAHWDRTNVTELGDAIAALVGRSDDEVEGVRRLFLEVYVPPPPRAPATAALPPVSLPLLRRHAWAIAAAAAVVLAIGATVAIVNRTPPMPTPVIAPVVPPVLTANAEQAVTVPPPPEPDLPPAPERLERRPATAAFGAGFLAALAFFWSMKVRDVRRAWLRDAWSAVRATLPGPYHFDEIVRDRPARLPKTDIEDAATMLGRVFSKRAQAKALDVPATLRATLRRGLMPTLVTKPRRIAESILVLQDVCQEMRLWHPKVDGFLADLRRQGISLQRMYFDADLTRVSDRPHRPATSLESVLRARPDAPVLVIGSGTGLAAMIASDDQTWLKQLGQRLRKSWLTPVSDVRLWPAEFNALPFDVWPMTRLGLLMAARQLAGMDAAPSLIARRLVMEEGRVTREDIERLKRLASLVPHPSPALLDLLRRRFAPDVPDATVVHLMIETGAGSPVVQLSDKEVARSLAAIRRENPDLEGAAREMILGVLTDSEPVAGSLAHERWRIAVAVQQFAIGDLAGDKNAASNARTALDRIAEGPLWEEAREAIAAIPSTSTTTRARTPVGKPGDMAASPPPDNRRLLSVLAMPWSWPGLRELVPATLAALLILGAALALNVLPARAVEHVTDAYDLQYSPTPSVSAPQLSVRLKDGSTAVPRTVDLYQGDQVFRPGIALDGSGPAIVPLASSDTGKYYQARATLSDGNLALSAYVWVTSDQLTFVLIDALPWANVAIEGNGTTTASQQTPFSAALMPGSYQVRFENPNLTPPSTLSQALTVPGAGNTLRVTMPGFDAARAVDALMPRSTSKQ